MVSITGPGLSAAFQYDALDRRIGKTINGVTTAFLHSGDNVVQEQSGVSPTANILAGGIDRFFSRTDSSGTTGPLVDAVGSAIALTDASGTVQTQYAYEPFGNVSVSGTANSNQSQFTGRENDGIGLYYYRARYYSPLLHRFIGEDPIGFAGGDVNLYGYVGNSPTMEIDPFGLATTFHADEYGRLMPGPPPTGGRKDKGSAGGLAATGMIAACTTTAPGAGALIGVGVLGILALYIAKNPPKAIPATPPIDCGRPRSDCAREMEECLKWAAEADTPEDRLKQFQV